MNINKDYYAILGVLPSAEIVVIKAAYRALSKRYHPDIYTGANAEEKMSEINDAYSVLSDENTKRAYDEARGEKSHDGDEYFNDDFGSHETFDPLDADWGVVVKYYPYLAIAEQRLARISKRLGYSYKAYILEAKDFDDPRGTARRLELAFLHQYFGRKQSIIEFAYQLISDDRKDILLELNRAVRILGESNVGDRVISTLKEEFSYQTAHDTVNSPGV